MYKGSSPSGTFTSSGFPLYYRLRHTKPLLDEPRRSSQSHRPRVAWLLLTCVTLPNCLTQGVHLSPLGSLGMLAPKVFIYWDQVGRGEGGRDRVIGKSDELQDIAKGRAYYQ